MYRVESSKGTGGKLSPVCYFVLGGWDVLLYPFLLIPSFFPSPSSLLPSSIPLCQSKITGPL